MGKGNPTPDCIGDLGELAVGLYLELEKNARVVFSPGSRSETDLLVSIPRPPRAAMSSEWLVQVKTRFEDDPEPLDDAAIKEIIEQAKAVGARPAYAAVRLSADEYRKVDSIVVTALDDGEELARYPLQI